MLVIDLNYKKSIEEVNQYLEVHREFLQKYYDKGVLLASGPKDPRTGGIIIALVEEPQMNNIIKEDPFYINEIADYSITSFEPVKFRDEIEPLLT